MSNKKRELTENQKLFLHYLFDEETLGNVKKAKELAGYAPNTSVTNVIDGLSDEILEYAKRHMASNTSKAMFHLLGVLEDPSQPGAANKLKAVNEIFNRAGLREKEDITSKMQENGVIILPPKSNMRIEIEGNDTNE